MKNTMTKKELVWNILVTLFALTLATIVSYLLVFVGGHPTNVSIVYMMAVVLISRYSNGYVPGVVASFISVVCVNLVFTYPYMHLNFAMDGYPITFIALMVISSITSATTTHLKHQNKIIHEREKLLMDAEKEAMRANLLRAISHDLRTPLTGIIGASSSYLENHHTMTEEEKAGLVGDIREDANWLLTMVENLLSVTRIRGSKAQVTKSLESVEEVVAEAVLRFHKRFPDTMVRVTVPDELVMVPMDATLIEQVIINLLENAVYHSNSKDPVSITLSREEGYARFDIRDRGIGIEPDRLSTIFDGYTSFPNRSVDSHKGMGIGLSICKTIITAHNGTITAGNESSGAVFTFTLPLGENICE